MRVERWVCFPSVGDMAYEEAKQFLRRAATLAERTAAIDAAMRLGMTMADIEAYLDWLDDLPGSQELKPEGPEEQAE